MLLCAGLGTRLGALSDERPKPLLPVCDTPILEFGIANLVAHGVTELVINLHHRGDVIEQALGDGRHLGAQIRYTTETTILGTGGGLLHALPLLDDHDAPILSLNGKLIFDLDIHALIAAYHARPDTLGCLVVQRVPDATAWGAVAVAHTPQGPQVTNILGAGEHMFCGVHMTRPSVLRRLPAGEACMVRQGYLPWIQAGGVVTAYEHSGGYFAEHSTPERYLASNLALLGGATLRHPPGQLVGVDPTARIHPSATLQGPLRIGPGARIDANAVVGPHAVVGAGAHVLTGTTLARCVVWPKATANGALRDCIVTTNGAICPASA